MKRVPVGFACGNIELEGLYYDIESPSPAAAVVVCHPHSLYGGSMHNNVTYAIAGALAYVNIASLLFNFRSVGASGGRFGGGIDERDDVRAALDYLQSREGIDVKRLGVAGYSFGGGVALPVACSDRRVKAFALISPYYEDDPVDLLKDCSMPRLVIGGSDDDIVTEDKVRLYVDPVAGHVDLEIISGADHFWGGYEEEMSGKVAAFFQAAFK